MGSVLVSLPVFSSSLHLHALSVEDVAEARRGHEELRDAVYNSAVLDRIEASCRDAVSRLAPAGMPQAEQVLWRSLIEYMVARGYQANEAKPQAIIYSEEEVPSLGLLAPDQTSSESWRMTSECVSQPRLRNGVGCAITNELMVSIDTEEVHLLMRSMPRPRASSRRAGSISRHVRRESLVRHRAHADSSVVWHSVGSR
jgi:hypothetical protein